MNHDNKDLSRRLQHTGISLAAGALIGIAFGHSLSNLPAGLIIGMILGTILGYITFENDRPDYDPGDVDTGMPLP